MSAGFPTSNHWLKLSIALKAGMQGLSSTVSLRHLTWSRIFVYIPEGGLKNRLKQRTYLNNVEYISISRAALGKYTCTIIVLRKS